MRTRKLFTLGVATILGIGGCTSPLSDKAELRPETAVVDSSTRPAYAGGHARIQHGIPSAFGGNEWITPSHLPCLGLEPHGEYGEWFNWVWKYKGHPLPYGEDGGQGYSRVDASGTWHVGAHGTFYWGLFDYEAGIYWPDPEEDPRALYRGTIDVDFDYKVPVPTDPDQHYYFVPLPPNMAVTGQNGTFALTAVMDLGDYNWMGFVFALPYERWTYHVSTPNNGTFEIAQWSNATTGLWRCPTP